MKKLFLLVFFFYFGLNAFSQDLKATKEKALINFLVENKDEKPIEEKIEIVSIKTKQKISLKSNKQGLVSVLVPKNDTYIINMVLEPNYDKIEIPDIQNYTLDYKVFYNNEIVKTEIKSIVHLNLKKPDGKPLSEELTFTSKKDKQSYTFKPDINGKADFSLPIGDEYSISFKSAPDYAKLQIPNINNFEMNFNLTFQGSNEAKLYPSLKNALFKLLFLDFDSMPVPDENFYLVSKKFGTVYKGKTDKNGESFILVPIGDTYNCSSENFKNFSEQKVDAKEDLYRFNITLVFISTPEFLRRRELEAKLLKERELEWDKMKKDYEEYMKTKASDISYTFNYGPVNDTVFFAVLNRNKQWKNKLIILDVTGSMRPYTDQVKMWYNLHFTQSDPIQFVMFNDGNNMPDNLKVIGKTGGLHYCIYCDKSTFNKKLDDARNAGGGGDGPENDLEATLAAINNCKNYSEIILVADNYSTVKDIALLKLINKPVKVILCGVYDNRILSDYLDIAYHTNGSVHTMEEDILNLGNSLEGVKIKIGKHYYVLTRGKFVYYTGRN